MTSVVKQKIKVEMLLLWGGDLGHGPESGPGRLGIFG